MPTSVRRLTARLAATPAEFLADPDVVAVVSDLLVRAGGVPLDRTTAPRYLGDERRRRLTSIACWLAADDELLAAADDPAAGIRKLLTERVPPLAALVEPLAFVRDEDRREELARLALACIGILPAGETHAQAQDRLDTVDSVRRREVLAAAAAAEQRAAAVREAMARKQAEEAAARHTQY